MSRRLVLRVQNPSSVSARRQTPEDEPEPSYSGADAMDVDEAEEGNDDGGEDGEGGEEDDEGVEDEDGEMQEQEDGDGEGEEGDGQEEVDVEGEGDESAGGDARGRVRGRGRGRGRGRTKDTPTGTPKPRGRGRGRPRGRPRGSGRGGKTVRARDASPMVVPEGYNGPKPYKFVNGQPLFFENDELTTDNDPKGDEKIDARGNLLGGREFKAPTFKSPMRDDPDRQYMLSIDAARTSGFRDSLYYFRRNPQLVKLPLGQAEKERLIEIGRLPNSLKSRSVTLVTARSAYKVHGAKMIKNGRWVIDDYYEDRAIAEGKTPGELVGEIAQEPVEEPLHSTNQPGTTTAADKIYRVGGPSTIYGGSGDDAGPAPEIRMAAVLQADRELAKMRRAAIAPPPALQIMAQVPGQEASALLPVMLDGDSTRLEKRSEVADEVWSGDPPLGWYEPHTGVWHYRADTQPTRAKLMLAPPTREAIMADGVLGGAKVGSNAWGIASVKTFMELPGPGEKAPGEFVWEG